MATIGRNKAVVDLPFRAYCGFSAGGNADEREIWSSDSYAVYWMWHQSLFESKNYRLPDKYPDSFPRLPASIVCLGSFLISAFSMLFHIPITFHYVSTIQTFFGCARLPLAQRFTF